MNRSGKVVKRQYFQTFPDLLFSRSSEPDSHTAGYTAVHAGMDIRLAASGLWTYRKMWSSWEVIMAKRIAQFHKVSFEQFKEGYLDEFGAAREEEIRKIYDAVRLPCRATSGSAGYDFYAPVEIVLEPGKTVKIPTGVCVEMQEDWAMKCYPRSGLGFKYRLQLNNTVGIIDSDYYYSDNEGHIFVKLTNDSKEGKTVRIEAGKGFMQGIFVEYGITVDDDVTAVRNGGLGSTT